MYCVYMLRLIMNFSGVPSRRRARGGGASMGGEGDLKAMVSELKSIWPRFARHKT
jgi:hypothetical protein